jgi:hypothetical protein
VSLAVNNLFDTALDVRDEAGLVPVGYQRAYLEPLGRSVRVSFRKLFTPPPAVRRLERQRERARDRGQEAPSAAPRGPGG